MQEFKVGAADAGKRTDIFLTEKYPTFSRSALKNLFTKKMVQVNNKTEEPGDKLKAGDIVSVDSKLLNPVIKKINLPVIYEDNDVVVVNKPAGVLAHSKGALNTEATFASFLKPRITDEKLSDNRAGVVHRLDRLTSGVIIGAKNSKALKYLQKQFAQRRVIKTYEAIVEGEPSPKQAVIDAPIMRNPAKPQTFKVGVGGKAAQTEYKILQSLKRNGRSYSLLKLKPTTGRTHQLRIHLAYIGHPVVGDMVYGAKTQQESLMLHASNLELKLPNGKKQSFSAPLPENFKEFL